MSVTNTGASPDHPRPDAGNGFPQAVLFDLLTALLDSWTVWNAAAGSEPQGRAWRAEYLRRTYGCGAYLPMSNWWPRPPRRSACPLPRLPRWRRTGAAAGLGRRARAAGGAASA